MGVCTSNESMPYERIEGEIVEEGLCGESEDVQMRPEFRPRLDWQTRLSSSSRSGAMSQGVTAKEASDIIAVKYPDLADEFHPRELSKTSICITPPPPSRQRTAKRPQYSPHPKRMKLVDERSSLNVRIAERPNLELLYPSMYSPDDCNQDEDALILSITPLRAGKMASVHLRSLATPPRKKSKRVRDAMAESVKRSRPRHANHTTVGITHKILRLCGASRSIFSSKYMSIPG